MRRFALVGGVLVVALIASLLTRAVVADDEDPVVIVHWSNSHPMREGLMPAMAERFNREDHETASGRPIEIVVLSCDSSDQVDDVVARVAGAALDGGCEDDDGNPAPDPTIITPQSDDWLVDLNHRVGRDVVDLTAIETIAETYLGIVTYRDMAQCLGWPETPFGYQDLLDLHSDQRGWAAHADCWQTEWGQEPLLAFTNPNTSTSGRNVLVSLYAMAARTTPDKLTVADVQRPEVAALVHDFQQLVDHYMPGTIPLNTKIAQGREAGHFFLMPEDNLVSLFKGNEKAIAFDGTEKRIDPVTDLVMIYPEEGSVLNSNPAALVDSEWVSAEESESAEEWIDFLRADDQQHTFLDAGFRPAEGTNVTLDEDQMSKWGLDAQQPVETIEPGSLAPAVLDQIIESWGAVKKPSIVTLVVDLSGSMEGEKLEDVQDGLRRLLDAMSGPDSASPDSKVGLVTFAHEVGTVIEPTSLDEAKVAISGAIDQMEASGTTALYDAVARAVDLTDAAQGRPDSTRAVVVLSDGAATAGDACLHDLVAMSSDAEADIAGYCGKVNTDGTPLDMPQDELEHEVPVEEVNGEELLLDTDHEVQVFFVGFGDADIQVGRILAEATKAQYRGQTDEDLAAVIEALSGYF